MRILSRMGRLLLTALTLTTLIGPPAIAGDMPGSRLPGCTAASGPGPLQYGVPPASRPLAQIRDAAANIDPTGGAATMASRLSLAVEATQLGRPGQVLALSLLASVADAARAQHDEGWLARAIDRSAQVYEDAGHVEDALALSAHAVALAGRHEDTAVLLQAEWRRARLLRAQGSTEAALAAYRRTADHLERVRLDIPVTYADGRSSFRTTFAPIYQNLADLLLQSGGEGDAQLREARAVLERIKQSELEDYLGERCLALQAREALPEGTAVLYPALLPDRLELLIEWRGQITRHTVAVRSATVEDIARRYARELRIRGWVDSNGQLLSDWLLAPAEALAGDQLRELIVVADGALRLVPLASLPSTRGGYVAQHYRVGVSPSLSLAHPAATRDAIRARLAAGLAEPGEVVNRLPPETVSQILPGVALSDDAQRSTRLSEALSLPGVRQEIAALEALPATTVLLDKAFSRQAFAEAVKSGRYSVVHIASHGVFGSSAATTFIMAHDEIITIDALADMLAGRPDGAPIDLLTLSACETAEGDDRAPLGIAGAALRARARSALGSLWAVSDAATQQLMAAFYQALADGAGKADALQQAQRALIDSAQFHHPYYWAAFVLVGDTG